MTTLKRIAGKMIPAVESAMQTPSMASIDTVPAVAVIVKSVTSMLECTAVVDTGASISMLDKSLSSPLGLGVVSAVKVRTQFPRVPHRAYPHSVDLEMIDAGGDQTILFAGVPVLVTDLHRPVMILGRRGVLEWLRIEIDYPAGTMALVRSEGPSDQYPALTSELSGFERIMETMDSHGIAQGIMLLAMELERYVDELLLSDEALRNEMELKPLNRMSFREKLLTACRGVSSPSLLAHIEQFVKTRNAAAHGYQILEPQSGEHFLQAAEVVMRCLAEERGRVLQ